ncbi:spore cortex biosynthesis protein YabQ [Salipaludibacillus sp. HK11]|uniref:spore cortex biosynthesis protein YabQ n=1 Tax=Salipaludibacillus sp. HK11 TaxID=3394320 RepID=UPI0039FDBE77
MSLDVQMASLLASTLMGIGLAGSLDTYERILGKRTSFTWLRMINDFLFWIAQALIYFGVLLFMNHGEVRFYLVLAVLLGYAIYRALFERTYRKILEQLLYTGNRLVHILVRITYAFVINPTKGLLKLLYRLSMIVVTTCWIIVSTFIYWVFKPIYLMVKYVDRKIGQPFIKQRTIIVNRINNLLKRISYNRKNK